MEERDIIKKQPIHYNWFDIEKETPDGKRSYDFVLAANEKASGRPKRKIPVVEVIELSFNTQHEVRFRLLASTLLE